MFGIGHYWSLVSQAIIIAYIVYHPLMISELFTLKSFTYSACKSLRVHVPLLNLFFYQGTDRTDQIDFLKQLRVISDNAKLGR